MRSFICSLLIVLCLTTTIFAQKTVTSPPTRRPVLFSQFVEAEKAWAPFWKTFSSALRRHDRQAFKDLISKDFRCYESYACKCSDFSDKRDSFFCLADDVEIRLNIQHDWWQEIDWIFTKPSKIRRTRLGKIQNVDGEVIRIIEYVHPDTWKGATFRFEDNMKWYFLDVGTGGA